MEWMIEWTAVAFAISCGVKYTSMKAAPKINGKAMAAAWQV